MKRIMFFSGAAQPPAPKRESKPAINCLKKIAAGRSPLGAGGAGGSSSSRRLGGFVGLFILFFSFPPSPLSAQEHIEVFKEGQQLFESKEYYEAYLRFNAAMVLSKNLGKSRYAKQSRKWLDKSALGIQQQQSRTDSLLQIAQKLTDAFYFYDDHLALAYNNGRYGFINKQGEIVIRFTYDFAANFDEETGYAKVVKNKKELWLAPNGREYPGEKNVNTLPKVEKQHKTVTDQPGIIKKKLDVYKTQGRQVYYRELNDGVQLYNEGLYYDAYLRFNATVVLAENAENKKAVQLGKLLKDTAIYEIRQLFVQAKDALTVAQNIRESIYYYDDKYALAQQNDQFYFIDQNGEAVSKLGRWEKASHFDRKGFAAVEKDNKKLLLDSIGRTFKVAYTLSDLNTEVTALDLQGVPLDSFPSVVFSHPQLQVLLLDGKIRQKSQFATISPDIQKLKNLLVLSLRIGHINSLPAEIGQLKKLEQLDLYYNHLESLPNTIGQLQQLKKLVLSANPLKELPPEIGQLSNLSTLELLINQLTSLPSEFCQLKKLKTLELGNNKLSHLPPNFGQLESLTTFFLPRTELTSLPLTFGQLKQLSVLNLMNNKLSIIPPEFGGLKNLTLLNLTGNQLTTIPAEIGQLKKLNTLIITFNPLKDLPDEIWEMTSLSEHLWLGLSQHFSEQKNYALAYRSIKTLIKNNPDQNRYWHNISFYALFVDKPQEAIEAAQKTLMFNPEAVSVETNLALGYLLNNEWSKAEKIYKKWKGQKFPRDSRLCDEVFLKDIQGLEEAGVSHPDFKKVKALFKQ